MGRNLTQQDTTSRVLYLRTRLYKGLYTRVAKQLGVSDSVTRRVALGLGQSKRIEAALIKEMRRIERHIEKVVGENAA